MTLLLRITFLTILTYASVLIIGKAISVYIPVEFTLMEASNINGTLVYDNEKLSGAPLDTISYHQPLEGTMLKDVFKLNNVDRYVKASDIRITSINLGMLFELFYFFAHIFSCIFLFIHAIKTRQNLKYLLTFEMFTPFPVIRVFRYLMSLLWRRIKRAVFSRPSYRYE